MRSAYRFFIWVCFVLCVSCGGNRSPKIINENTANPLHLIPFSCSYLGFPIGELSSCWIACSKSVVEEYDIESFSASLECAHPDYSVLRCGIE